MCTCILVHAFQVRPYIPQKENSGLRATLGSLFYPSNFTWGVGIKLGPPGHE